MGNIWRVRIEVKKRALSAKLNGPFRKLAAMRRPTRVATLGGWSRQP
jgi:hypothetical protein